MKHPTEWPVWWETHDGRPAGQHMAKVLAVNPYLGKYTDMFTHTLELSAPGTRAGKLEMAVRL